MNRLQISDKLAAEIRNKSFITEGAARTLDLYQAYIHNEPQLLIPEGRLMDLFYALEIQLDEVSDWLGALADKVEWYCDDIKKADSEAQQNQQHPTTL